MRALKYLRRTSALTIRRASIHGGAGILRLGDTTASVVWGTDEDGWEHVSVSPLPENILPSWDDMCKVKDIFWSKEEAVFQIHPPRSKYVNMIPNCLHLWRPKNGVHGMNPEWDEVTE